MLVRFFCLSKPHPQVLSKLALGPKFEEFSPVVLAVRSLLLEHHQSTLVSMPLEQDMEQSRKQTKLSETEWVRPLV